MSEHNERTWFVILIRERTEAVTGEQGKGRLDQSIDYVCVALLVATKRRTYSPETPRNHSRPARTSAGVAHAHPPWD